MATIRTSMSRLTGFMQAPEAEPRVCTDPRTDAALVVEKVAALRRMRTAARPGCISARKAMWLTRAHCDIARWLPWCQASIGWPIHPEEMLTDEKRGESSAVLRNLRDAGVITDAELDNLLA